ncbi:Hemin transport system permease protein HmuU [compost metagenome]
MEVGKLADAERAAPDAVAAYGRDVRKRFVALCVLALLATAALILDVVTGPSTISPLVVLKGVFDPAALSTAQQAIVWQVRLPYALMATLVGAALALAGAEMQTVLNNPLASPFTLGVSSAASFGASLAIVLGVGASFIGSDWLVPLNAFVFAFGSVLALQALARMKGSGVENIVLFGIALVFAFNALTALVQFLSSAEALQQLVFWTMGSLSRATWGNVGALALVVAAVTPFSLLSSRGLTALRLGEDRAMSFGVDVKRLRFLSLLRVSLLSATAVAFVGAIGFIGLVGPHIARLLVGEDHRFFLPASILSGAIIMSLASAASKAIVPGVLMPVGIVTAVIGVPVFLLLIFRNGGRA